MTKDELVKKLKRHSLVLRNVSDELLLLHHNTESTRNFEIENLVDEVEDTLKELKCIYE